MPIEVEQSGNVTCYTSRYPAAISIDTAGLSTKKHKKIGVNDSKKNQKEIASRTHLIDVAVFGRVPAEKVILPLLQKAIEVQSHRYALMRVAYLYDPEVQLDVL